MAALDGPPRRSHPRARELVLRLLAATGLLLDAYLHLDLASDYDLNTAAISQGDLFRAEAALAAIGVLLVLLARGRLAALPVFLIAAAGVAAVLLFTFVDVGAVGPYPNMYEPVWYAEKTHSLIGGAGAAVAALVLLVSRSRRRPAASRCCRRGTASGRGPRNGQPSWSGVGAEGLLQHPVHR